MGFGFSPNGTMVYSDVIIGWVADNSEIFFDDRYAIQYSKPPTDIELGGENNVQLLSLTYIDGFLLLFLIYLFFYLILLNFNLFMYLS